MDVTLSLKPAGQTSMRVDQSCNSANARSRKCLTELTDKEADVPKRKQWVGISKYIHHKKRRETSIFYYIKHIDMVSTVHMQISINI
jgi:hypothetical protein